MVKIEKYWKKWRQQNTDEAWNLLLKEIWNIYYPKLCVFIGNSYSSDYETTGDIARDILLKIFEKIESYNPEYRFSTWIYMIARNHMTDLYRSSCSGKMDYADEKYITEVPDISINIEEDLILRENVLSLEKAVEELFQEEKELIYLRYYEKLKYPEISAVTNLPVGTIKNRIYLLKKN